MDEDFVQSISCNLYRWTICDRHRSAFPFPAYTMFTKIRPGADATGRVSIGSPASSLACLPAATAASALEVSPAEECTWDGNEHWKLGRGHSR